MVEVTHEQSLQTLDEMQVQLDRALALAEKATEAATTRADRIFALQAEGAALKAELAEAREKLESIRSLAMKRQAEGGPDGTLADIEGFARAYLDKEPGQ